MRTTGIARLMTTRGKEAAVGLELAAAARPEVIVLAPRADALPSSRPPVRIFVGSEAAQYRAERVLLWSIEQVRDPGRTYEIHLMKNLPGFRTWLWSTRFKSYRYAVPHLAGSAGRAIYNDVDQVYLSDPGELFDLDLADHGYLAKSETDTSVMLLDCERMAGHFTLARAQRQRNQALLDAVVSSPGVYGALPGVWNARDEEYVSGHSKLLHYTTVHKQPWRPFPERFLYQPNAAADLWLALEQAADEAGFQIRTANAPSEAYLALWRGLRGGVPVEADETVASGPVLDDAIGRLVARTAARSVLQVVPGGGQREPDVDSAWEPAACGGSGVETHSTRGLAVDREGLFVDAGGLATTSATAVDSCDGVVCSARLDRLPLEDVPHVVERLFARADRFVFAAVCCEPPARRRPFRPPQGTVGQPVFWEWVFRSAARRHPGVFWQVAYVRRSGPPAPAGVPFYALADAEPEEANEGLVGGAVEFLQGGPFPETLAGGAGTDALPRVWMLVDHKPGHSTQSEGLSAELDWPCERIELSFNFWAELPNAWTRGTRRSLTPQSAAQLRAPWPDLVIATGRRTAPIASWVRKQSRGATRTVQMGRIGAFEKDTFDLGVSPAYACLYPDNRRIVTAAPVTRVSPVALRAAEARWRPHFASAPAPRIALLVGGQDPEHSLTPEYARRMGDEVRDMAKREGGSVLATTSRRSSPRAALALEEALGDVCAYFHAWSETASPEDNPYMGYLALADAIVVTGESASMLAEACASGKPVYIYPLELRPPGPRTWLLRAERRLADAVTARAYAQPVNRRGKERRQRGLELVCATLLARGFIRTSGHSERLHRELEERGLAKRFDGKLAPIPTDYLTDVERVADRVRELMGISVDAGPTETL